VRLTHGYTTCRTIQRASHGKTWKSASPSRPPSSYGISASFRSFVYGIAANNVADAFRARRRNRTDAMTEVPDCPVRPASPLGAWHVFARLPLLGHLQRIDHLHHRV
jgi:DNA-directed RNA polymerase specialized sigma24 family protein